MGGAPMKGAYAALAVFTVLYVVTMFCSSSSIFPKGPPLEVEYFAWIGKCLTGLIGVTFIFHLMCEFKVDENWGGRVGSLSSLSEDDQDGMSNAAKQRLQEIMREQTAKEKEHVNLRLKALRDAAREAEKNKNRNSIESMTSRFGGPRGQTVANQQRLEKMQKPSAVHDTIMRSMSDHAFVGSHAVAVDHDAMIGF